MTNPITSQRSGGEALTLLELNELNFDLVRRYVERGPEELPNFARLLKMESRETSSEDAYETLEPWIQWVSAHSGLTAKEHGVHRLGDAVHTDIPQLLGTLERQGFKVGAVSPMNMPNQVARPAYFIPDPWTQTPTDGSLWSIKIWNAISQAVNDNAQGRLERSTVFWLGLAFLRFARLRRLKLYASLVLKSKGAPWRKALFLDLFLNDVHTGLVRAARPDLTVLFLNAAAHIQHHYLFNAKALASRPFANPSWYVAAEEDPFFDMLKVYDAILGDHLDSQRDLVAATGLSQVPYDRVKFYYRLKDHPAFLQRLGVPFKEVVRLMTRDFLINFDDSTQADRAQQVLSGVRSVSDDLPIFGEIDHRGTSLFVTLTYPHEIARDFKARTEDGRELELHDDVAFVAIKNGMHSGRGFAFFRGRVSSLAPAQGEHVKFLHDMVLKHFGMGGRATHLAGGDAG